MENTAQLVAIILLAAFAIERIGSAATFVLGPAPEKPAEQRRRALLLFALAGTIALAVVDFGGVRIVERLQPGRAPRFLDYWLTWLVVVAGSDRIKAMLEGTGGSRATKDQAKGIPPITIVVAEKTTARLVA